MMKFSTMVRFLLLIAQAICVALVMPALLARESGSGTGVLGRYSWSYALILAAYGVYILFWWALLLRKFVDARLPQIVPQVLRRGSVILAMAFVVFGLQVGLILLLGIWNLSRLPLLAAMLGVIFGPLALLSVADTETRKELRRTAPVVLVSFMISLLALEVGLRIVFPFGVRSRNIWLDFGDPTPWRQYVGWAAPSNAYYYATSPGEIFVPIRTNSHGLRDREYTYEKPDDVFRILIVGDSVTFAQEVKLEETFQEVAERLLNAASSRRIEVIAGGIGGWGNDQELLFLQYEGCRYEPDLVLLQFTTNDPSNNNATDGKPYFTLDEEGELHLQNFPIAVPSELDSGVDMLGPILIHSRTALVLWQLALDMPIGTTSGVAVDPQESDPDGWRKYWPLTTALIAALRDEAASCGASFAGFMAPDVTVNGHEGPMFVQFDDTLTEMGIPHPSPAYIAEPFEQYLETGSVLDLTWPIVKHYTPLGYGMLGEQLANWLIENAMIPLD